MSATRCRPGPATRHPVRDLVEALLAYDDDTARALVGRAQEAVASRTDVFADLLQAAQTEIANLWYLGRASSADEVRAALTLRRIVDTMPPTPSVSGRVPSGFRCMLAMAHGDAHDLGMRMFALALEDHGWSTQLLCAVQHLLEVADLVVASRPTLFGLSAGWVPSLPEVQRTIAAVRRARVPVLVGGAAFNRRPSLWRSLGADGLGTDARVGVVLARRVALR